MLNKLILKENYRPLKGHTAKCIKLKPKSVDETIRCAIPIVAGGEPPSSSGGVQLGMTFLN